jgi:hypothetical protein
VYPEVGIVPELLAYVARAQALPQPPQFALSVCSSTHEPLQATSSPGHAHTLLPEQTSPDAPGQAVGSPHSPSDVHVSMSEPLHCVEPTLHTGAAPVSPEEASGDGVASTSMVTAASVADVS